MAEPKTEMKRLNRCSLHGEPKCWVDYDASTCPVCEIVFVLGVAKGTIEALRERIELLETVEGENSKLESRIFELEDRLPEQESPCEEPRRPEDMGARHGLDVAAGLKGADRD